MVHAGKYGGPLSYTARSGDNFRVADHPVMIGSVNTTAFIVTIPFRGIYQHVQSPDDAIA